MNLLNKADLITVMEILLFEKNIIPILQTFLAFKNYCPPNIPRLTLTSRTANSNMAPPGVHFTDLEPAISARVIDLNTFERVARSSPTPNTEQDT